jgi:diguanylate cyclase (GGDEF)-like protein
MTIVASVGLTVMLLFSQAFSLIASDATSKAVNLSKRATILSDAYERARFSAIAEESLDRKYRLEPGLGIAREHAAAGRDFTAAFETIAHNASPASAADALPMLALHAQYVVASKRMFAAVDAHDPAEALKLDENSVDSILASIQNRVYEREGEQDTIAAAAFQTLQAMQASDARLAIARNSLGFGCLLAFLFVISAYRHRLIANHAAEVRRMEEAVLVDSLTKIGNHGAFKDDIQREMALAVRHKVPLTLAMVDVDEFKLVNDQNGHVQGDRVLLDLANVLRAGRAGDRAYRLGGDEFALILPHTSGTAARAILERVRSAASNALNGSTVSIGFSTVEDYDITAETLQNQADAALYLTKRGGRNGVSQFEASNEGTWIVSTERVQGLRELLASEQIPVAFQPIWDVERAEIFAFEALMRPPASFGFPGPQDVFDLAERVGRAHELDRASRISALRRAADLPPHALLFLNISPQTLDRDFDLEEFVASVASFGFRPEHIVIEITERSISHVDNVVDVARSLQEAGFGIALDDTGAGHAGLEMMSRLSFAYVKIDRQVIVNAMSDRSARGVVAAIVAFSRVTGAYVIAEGIDDVAMLDFVDRVGSAGTADARGIRGAQGYLLNAPREALPAASEVFNACALLREHIVQDRNPPWPAEKPVPAGRIRSRFELTPGG